MPIVRSHPTRRHAASARPRAPLVALWLTLAIFVSACSSSKSGSASAGASSGGTSTTAQVRANLTVEVSHTYSQAPITVGINDGTFQRSGLTVKTAPYDPATAIPLVIQGQAQVGYAGLGAVLQAIRKGIPITIIAGTALNGSTAAQSLSGVLVRANSGISSFKDLSGKTVGLNALKNDAQAFLENIIDKAGGDSTKTRFVAVPFPGMANALSAGQVDAVAPVAPIVQAIQAAGNVDLGPYTGSGYPNGVYFAANSYLAKNRPVIEALRTALTAEYTALNKDRTPAISVMVNDYKTAPKTAASIPDAKWNVTVADAIYQDELAVMRKYAIIDGDVDLKTAVLS